jgi:hypothetical protein
MAIEGKIVVPVPLAVSEAMAANDEHRETRPTD